MVAALAVPLGKVYVPLARTLAESMITPPLVRYTYKLLLVFVPASVPLMAKLPSTSSHTSPLTATDVKGTVSVAADALTCPALSTVLYVNTTLPTPLKLGSAVTATVGTPALLVARWSYPDGNAVAKLADV